MQAWPWWRLLQAGSGAPLTCRWMQPAREGGELTATALGCDGGLRTMCADMASAYHKQAEASLPVLLGVVPGVAAEMGVASPLL